MFFKKFRSRSKSSAKSTKPSIDRVTSSSSTHDETVRSKIPRVTLSPPAVEIREGEEEEEGEGDEAREYREFLEKARKEEERKEREKLKTILRARETNMSPWAGRM